MIYDFIEIGTSDFGALIESADDTTVGLSIEPMQMYLDNLPDKKNVRKICIGISDCNRSEKLFYITPENIEKYKLPEFLRGCNTLGKPHHWHMQYLDGNSSWMLEAQDVEIITTKQMIDTYNVDGVKHLKIDTEGHDCIILLDYLKHCITNPSLFPAIIDFEKCWSTTEAVASVIQSFTSHGYVYEDGNTTDDGRLVKNN